LQALVQICGELGAASEVRAEHVRHTCPRNSVPLCCPRVGPPPDFEQLVDRRMQWCSPSLHWQCWSCMRVVQEEEVAPALFTDLALFTDPREHQYCPVHGPRARLVDFQNGTWRLVCVVGPTDDVPTPCTCAFGEHGSRGIFGIAAPSTETILISSDEEAEVVRANVPEHSEAPANEHADDFVEELAALAEIAYQFNDDISMEIQELAEIAHQFD